MGWTPTIHRIVRPGRRPYFRAKLGGRQIYLGTDYKQAARRFAELLTSSGTASPPAASVTVAISRFTTAQADPWLEYALKPAIRFARATLLVDVDAQWLEKYAAWLAERGYASKTAIHYVGAIRSCLAWCKARGWIEAVPPRPKMPRPMRCPRDIPHEELGDMLRRVPKANRPILEFISATGCRPSEARLLRWSNVHISQGVCVLLEHKTAKRTGRVRTIYLTPPALAILRGMARSGEYVFPSRRGTPYTATGLRSIVRRAGGRSVYALRHTFAQNALETDGVRLEDVARLLGHTGLDTVQVYAQVRNQRALDVAAALRPPGLRQVRAAPEETGEDAASRSPRRKTQAKPQKHAPAVDHRKGKEVPSRRSVRS